MKNLVLSIVFIFVSNAVFAQACAKTCDTKKVKNSYVLEGDVVKATLFHDNGAIAQIGTYTIENKLDGEWISFDAQGTKVSVASYDNGVKVGTWMFYQGDTIKEVSYENAGIAAVKTWTVTDTRVVSNKP